VPRSPTWNFQPINDELLNFFLKHPPEIGSDQELAQVQAVFPQFSVDEIRETMSQAVLLLRALHAPTIH